MLTARPGPLDLPRALSLLDGVLKSTDPTAASLHPLVWLLADHYGERQKHEMQSETNQQLKESQRKTGELRTNSMPSPTSSARCPAGRGAARSCPEPGDERRKEIRRCHILVIDDDEDAAAAFRAARRLGFRISTAASAERGLARIAVEPAATGGQRRAPAGRGRAGAVRGDPRHPADPAGHPLTAHGTIPDAVEATSRGSSAI